MTEFTRNSNLGGTRSYSILGSFFHFKERANLKILFWNQKNKGQFSNHFEKDIGIWELRWVWVCMYVIQDENCSKKPFRALKFFLIPRKSISVIDHYMSLSAHNRLSDLLSECPKLRFNNILSGDYPLVGQYFCKRRSNE